MVRVELKLYNDTNICSIFSIVYPHPLIGSFIHLFIHSVTQKEKTEIFRKIPVFPGLRQKFFRRQENPQTRRGRPDSGFQISRKKSSHVETCSSGSTPSRKKSPPEEEYRRLLTRTSWPTPLNISRPPRKGRLRPFFLGKNSNIPVTAIYIYRHTVPIDSFFFFFFFLSINAVQVELCCLFGAREEKNQVKSMRLAFGSEASGVYRVAH